MMKGLFLLAFSLPLFLMAQTEVANISGLCNEKKVYDNIDKGISFEGGSEALSEYLNQNITIEKKYKKNKGTVEMRFLFNCEGKLLQGKILNGNDGWIDKEVLASFKMTKKWKPAMLSEEAVDSYQNFSVNFNGKRFKVK